MKKDPTEFRQRFAQWKNGEKPYENGLPKYAGGKVPEYVQAGKDNSWVSVTNDPMGAVFQDLVVRPQSRGGNTTVGNWERQWSPKYEKPLETVSPEFDILSFVRGVASSLSKNVSKKSLRPQITASETTSNPYKYKSDKDVKDMFTKMREMSIRRKLAQISTQKPDLENDPFGIYDLASDVIHHEGMPAGVEDIFRHQILPRTDIYPLDYDFIIAKLSKYGYNTLDDYNWAKYVDDNLAGYLDSSTTGIAIRDGYQDFAGAHEFRHRMQRLIPHRKSHFAEREHFLNKAYDDDFINLPKNISPDDSLYGYELMADEAATTNLDARKWAFENFSDNPNIRTASIKEQNAFLDNLTDDQIIEAVVNSNGYGKKYIHFLEQKYHLLDNPKLNAQYANRFRNAMKYYGAASIPITMVIKNTQNELRNK